MARAPSNSQGISRYTEQLLQSVLTPKISPNTLSGQVYYGYGTTMSVNNIFADSIIARDIQFCNVRQLGDLVERFITVGVSSFQGTSTCNYGTSVFGVLGVGSLGNHGVMTCNTLIGSEVASNASNLTSSVYVGARAGLNASGASNVGIGAGAHVGGIGSGSSFNVFIGASSGFGIIGNCNVFLGRDSGSDLSLTSSTFIVNTISDSSKALLRGTFNPGSGLLGVNKIPAYTLDVSGDIQFSRNIYGRGNELGDRTFGALAIGISGFSGLSANLIQDTTILGVGAVGGTSSHGTFTRDVVIGKSAGFNAVDITDSILIGSNTGSAANGISGSILVGTDITNANAIVGTVILGAGAGKNATSATNGVILGTKAGSNVYGSSDCVILGTRSGGAANVPVNSVFIGTDAGRDTSNVTNSVLLGTAAAMSAQNAVNSAFILGEAGRGAVSTANSVMIGSTAGYSASNTSNSTLLGFAAGNSASNTTDSALVGSSAGRSAINTTNSVLLGVSAGAAVSNTTNTAIIGSSAGGRASNIADSVLVGVAAGNTARNISNGVIIGVRAGFNTSNSVDSVIIGTNAGYSVSGNSNVYIGTNAGGSNIGSGNIFLGISTGADITGINNTFIVNHPSKTSVSATIYSVLDQGWVGINKVPSCAMDILGDIRISGDITANFRGYYSNVSIGGQKGIFGIVHPSNISDYYPNATISSYNIFGIMPSSNLNGYYPNITVSSLNICGVIPESNIVLGTSTGGGLTLGKGSLSGTWTGSNYTIVGVNAYGGLGSHGIITGTTALGYGTGCNAVSSNDTYIGTFAGFGTTGESNVFVGYGAGSNATTGSRSVYIGASAGVNTVGSSNVFIGNAAGSDLTVASNTLIVNNGTQAATSNALINGRFDLQTVGINRTPVYSLDVSGSIRSTSDAFFGTKVGINTLASNFTLNVSGTTLLGSGRSKVGINDSDPSYELDVSGDFHVTGDTYADGAIYANDSYDGLVIGNPAHGGTYDLTKTGGYTIVGVNALGDAVNHGTINGTTAIGYYAGFSVSATNSTYVGAYVACNLTKDEGSVMLGVGAGRYGTTASHNVFIGSYAGSRSNGIDNIYIGKSAGEWNAGSGNVFIGKLAGWNPGAISNTLLIYNNDFTSLTPANALIYGKFNTGELGINCVPTTGYSLDVSGNIRCTGTISGTLRTSNICGFILNENLSGQYYPNTTISSYNISGIIRTCNVSGYFPLTTISSYNISGIIQTCNVSGYFPLTAVQSSNISGFYLPLKSSLSKIVIGTANSYNPNDFGLTILGAGAAETVVGKSICGCTLVGYQSGMNISGINNTGVGRNTGLNSVGEDNVMIGRSAGYTLSGSTNIAIGINTAANLSGVLNTVLGYEAGRNLIGSSNVVISDSAGYNLSGNRNVAIGGDSGRDLTGTGNTFVGFKAGQTVSGDNNTTLGVNSGNTCTGIENVLLGRASGYTISGSYNIAGGSWAAKSLLGNDNVAFGQNAGCNLRGAGNVAIGNSAASNLSGSSNIAIGYNAGANVRGNANFVVGSNSGCNLSGSYNFGFGTSAAENLIGADNIALGYRAGCNTTGFLNTMIGWASGCNLSGYDNIGIGCNTATSLVGRENIAIGAGSAGNLSGEFNVCIGNSAGNLAQGGCNVFIGKNAGSDLTTVSNTLIINNGVKPTSNALIYGHFATPRLGIGKIPTQGTLDVGGDVYCSNLYTSNGLVLTEKSYFHYSGDPARTIANGFTGANTYPNFSATLTASSGTFLINASVVISGTSSTFTLFSLVVSVDGTEKAKAGSVSPNSIVEFQTIGVSCITPITKDTVVTIGFNAVLILNQAASVLSSNSVLTYSITQIA